MLRKENNFLILLSYQIFFFTKFNVRIEFIPPAETTEFMRAGAGGEAEAGGGGEGESKTIPGFNTSDSPCITNN